MFNTSDHFRCHNSSHPESAHPAPAALMFSMAVVGNLAALALLRVRRPSHGPSPYRVLVTALLLTDLAGSVSVSPVVLVAYARRQTLVELGLCSYFAFSMTFFILSTLAVLCAVALERVLSIGTPYFYERHLSGRCVHAALGGIYVASGVFCVGPFVGLGDYVQYCPGTWCFLELKYVKGRDRMHIAFYASFLLLMMACTVACNVAVIYLLVHMYRKRKSSRCRAAAAGRLRRSMSVAEEVEYLLPLGVITVVYICCTLPLTMRVYINYTRQEQTEHHKLDLDAVRLLSFHSIINPWVFILLSPQLLKNICRRLRRPPPASFCMGTRLKVEQGEEKAVSPALEVTPG